MIWMEFRLIAIIGYVNYFQDHAYNYYYCILVDSFILSQSNAFVYFWHKHEDYYAIEAHVTTC